SADGATWPVPQQNQCSLAARDQRRGRDFLRERRAWRAPRLALARNTPAGHRPPAAPPEAMKQAQRAPRGLKAEAGKIARSLETPIGSSFERLTSKRHNGCQRASLWLPRV